MENRNKLIHINTSFLPMYTQKVIERTTTIETIGNGYSRRSMIEVIVYQLNENLIMQLQKENHELKKRIESIELDEQRSLVTEILVPTLLTVVYLLSEKI